ncbi:zinc finger protein 292b isoform 2-T2 [Pholidichthys leucotaenia]
MADEEAEQDRSSPANRTAETMEELRASLQQLQEGLSGINGEPSAESSAQYCQEFCRIFLEYASHWRVEEEPLPLVEVYMVALLSLAQASPHLSLQCENVPLVVERLSLFLELLLSLKNDVPEELWKDFKSSVQLAHSKLQENGINQLSVLSDLGHNDGVWSNNILQDILSNNSPPTQEVEEFLVQEGVLLLEMRLKQLMKEQQLMKAALLSKACSECPALHGKGHFKQTYLVCLCATSEQDRLMEELSKEDCRDGLEMICNLESDGDEGAAFSLCSAFLTRQLLQGDTYCAWELTLFWSKLLKRLEPSEQVFLDRCRQMSLLSKTVSHILFFIKVVQSEVDSAGLSVCIEMCIRALRMESRDGNTKAVCKTISCLLPTDLEVKRACQLTEFLLEPTVDSYYAVETLYNEPDQKLEEEDLPIANSLRCEVMLVLKTQWPFDPEFWDWKTLKRQCLALMGEEASIVSSIDSLNDTESPEEEEDFMSLTGFNNPADHMVSGTCDLKDVTDRKRKNREMKKLREKGFISARFRNWQAYMQYCVLCDKEFLGHRIVRHAPTHVSDGIYTCPICTQTFTSKETLVPHVTSHVKQSCKERLHAMKTTQKLCNPETAAPILASLQTKTQQNLHLNGDSLRQNKKSVLNTPIRVVCNEDNMCPVGQCRRSFKFFKNLIAHVKSHGDNEEAKTFLEMQTKKVVCQYCRRHFISVTHLNDHLQVHCGAKPYICIQVNCKASFLSNTELLIHKRTHSVFKARCMFPNCGKVFNAAFKLYDHEAQHYKTFTCKVLDCGKVFHSQQQLDLHQERHSLPEDQGSSSGLLEQSIKPGPSLIKQLLANNAPCKQESSQENGNTRTSVDPDHKRLPVLIENLLKSSQESLEAVGQCGVKCKPQECSATKTEGVTKSVIQSMHSQMTEPDRKDVLHHCVEYPRPPQPVPPLETILDQNLQNLPHMLVSDGSDGKNETCSFTPMAYPVQKGEVCSSNSTISQPHNCVQPAKSQLPLPTASLQQPSQGKRADNSVMCSSNAGAPPALRERFHCAFEICSRHYSSYKSVVKHMKTVHPDFYEQWKAARTKIKVTYTPASNKSSVSHRGSVSLSKNPQTNRVPVRGIQRQNVIQTPPYINMGTKSVSTVHSAPAPNQNGTLLMANVLNPIVVSQLGSNADSGPPQLQVPGINWQTGLGSEQIQYCGSSQGYPSNLQMMPQMGSTSTDLQVNVPSCSTTRAAESLQSALMDSQVQTHPSSYMSGPKEMSQPGETFQGFTVKMESGVVSRSKTAVRKKAMKNPAEAHFPPPDKASQNRGAIQPQNGPIVTENNSAKLPKKTRRIKWPAIVRDGKFFCRRCFRQFDNPKSLGGHLSKRTVCKPYNEGLLNADLPQSFLDLLNSEQSVTTSQPQQSYPAAIYQEKPNQSEMSTPATAQDLPVPNESNDILKQIMTESNLSELFGPTVSQTLFQNTSVTFGAAERLPGSSVIQHTENVLLKRENNVYDSTHYPQPSIDVFAGNEYPDPLISQILTENPSTAVQGSVTTNHIAPAEVHAEGCPPVTTIQPSTTDSNSASQTVLPAQFSLTPPKAHQVELPSVITEQEVKKRLRDQILAGDFQRRQNSCNSGNSNPKASPISVNQTSHSSHKSVSHSVSTDTKTASTNQGQVSEENSVIIPGTPAEIERLLNTQSFTSFREPSDLQQALLSPMGFPLNDPDPEPSSLSTNQLQCFTEIESAFEKLDLVREVQDQKSVVVPQTEPPKPVPVPQTKPPKPVPVSEPPKPKFRRCTTFIKPFPCEKESCTFSSVSSESLWKHLSKSHSYTTEMVNDVKKRYGLYAPYKCQKCIKAFTRNSNLRAHYTSFHKLSAKEIADLDLKRKQEKDSAFAALKKQHRPPAPKRTERKKVESGANLYPPQDSVKEYPSQPSVLCSNTTLTNHKSLQDNRSTVIHPLQAASIPSVHNHTVIPPVQVQTSTLGLQAIAPPWPQQQHRCCPKVTAQPMAGQQVGASLPKVSLPFTHALSAAAQALGGAWSPNKEHTPSRQPPVKPSMQITKRTKEKKPKSGNTASLYRPYSCVHQGCTAAFTIQHNLILHYRAVHQSALSALEVNKEVDLSEPVEEMMDHTQEEPDVEFPQISEFRCQVKDCCCVFPQVPSLLQHYLQVHEFSLDKVTTFLSSIKLGKFVCGHRGCTESFTAFKKYINHVREQHKDIKRVRAAQLNGSFKCEIEGCDRSYATKSNLLRHVLKKHQDLHKPKLKNQQLKHRTKQKKTILHQITKTSDGKENIESNKKVVVRASHTKKVNKSRSHWVRYGKPSLKSKVEASAMCTKKLPLQYPCMIKGCESVMKSEKTILKHYMGHGLSEKYLELHRSHFIFCKKIPRLKCRSVTSDDSKSDNTSDLSDNDVTAEPAPEGVPRDPSKPLLRKRTAARISAPFFDTKLSTDESSDGQLVKRKRGRPPKHLGKIVKPKKIPRPTKTELVHSSDGDASAVRPVVTPEEQSTPLASFKPMGFEMSFLKFLEQSNTCEHPLMKTVTVAAKTKNPLWLKSTDNSVRFTNRQKLKFLSNVRIRLDAAFSGHTDPMLKQLQDMQPVVLLDKCN